jgi:hypothetical protein
MPTMSTSSPRPSIAMRHAARAVFETGRTPQTPAAIVISGGTEATAAFVPERPGAADHGVPVCHALV